MLTQNPAHRASALLKGATKPVRIYLGYRGSEKRLIAQLERKDIVLGLPWTVLTVAPETTAPDLADLLTANWQRLAAEYAERGPTPTSTPAQRHTWRRAHLRTATR